VLIARLIADPETLGDNLARAMELIEDAGFEVAGAGMLDFSDSVVEIEVIDGEQPADRTKVRTILDHCFPACDMLISDRIIETPRLFVSDMDSTMIAAECIDELADFAGLKARIADITERAMQGELDFDPRCASAWAFWPGFRKVRSTSASTSGSQPCPARAPSCRRSSRAGATRCW
jgi:phosphoserine phosphatase